MDKVDYIRGLNNAWFHHLVKRKSLPDFKTWLYVEYNLTYKIHDDGTDFLFNCEQGRMRFFLEWM